jgi:hypothetical protein
MTWYYSDLLPRQCVALSAGSRLFSKRRSILAVLWHALWYVRTVPVLRTPYSVQIRRQTFLSSLPPPHGTSSSYRTVPVPVLTLPSCLLPPASCFPHQDDSLGLYSVGYSRLQYVPVGHNSLLAYSYRTRTIT